MITVKNLTKRYGDYVAVDDVSFTCRPGQVTGFLGPNGAGKSTTMRIIAGLTPPTSGVAQLYGVDYRTIPNPATQVGILLDASAQHAGRTGAEVLRLSAMTMGIGRDRVDEMLELVSLTPEEAGRRVRNYSLGMRQRLGIAAALLGDPKILILDEPANGLDPAGIHWMRTLLRGYADRGGTVLLSSHLLHEIEIVADDIVVIGQGRIVAQGTKDELLAGAGTRVRSLDDAALGEALVAAGITVQRNTSGGLDVDADPVDVGRAAAAVGVVLTELRPADGAQLEAMFLQLTAETQREHTTLEGANR
ncbi:MULTISPECIES: ABC transporter ATP-binding protein [Gordonia]|uniref:ABC transporter ATP-binding protein n=1 Tax=Gordonia TaxID=2053 RepID=UPI001EF465CB|nr:MULTISPECIES: ATP-binding cassette domain-containing protein [Gordonia]MCG7631041.1 ATP-binding cassette domain-containing protein [Gordonia sp. McavH-238-E]UPW07115.1 ATP-binding cassette domain-containing protein [Gordonia terrae]